MKILERLRATKIVAERLVADGWLPTLDYCEYCHQRGYKFVRDNECFCAHCKQGNMWPETVERMQKHLPQMTTLEQITPVPILQREGEFDVLLDMYCERQPMRVLEVGTYHGGTLYHWLRLAQPGALVVSLDSYATEVDNRHLYREWTPEGVSLVVVDGDSRAEGAIEAAGKAAPYDWIFIDAGHAYDEVKADWLNDGPMCGKGGLVGFHDILYSRRGAVTGVAALWDEIKAEHETLELVSDPTTQWHGIGCVLM